MIVQSDYEPLETIIMKPLWNIQSQLKRMLLSLQKYDINLVYSWEHPEEAKDVISIWMCSSNKIQIWRNQRRHNKIFNINESYTAYHEKDGLGRKDSAADEAKHYWSFTEELSTINGVVFKVERLVTPKVTRKEVLKQLHKKIE